MCVGRGSILFSSLKENTESITSKICSKQTDNRSMNHGPTGIVRLYRKRLSIKNCDNLSPILFIIYIDKIHKICKRRTNRYTVGYWSLRLILVNALLYRCQLIIDTISQTNKKSNLICYHLSYIICMQFNC